MTTKDKKHSISFLFIGSYIILTLALLMGVFYMSKQGIKLPEWANTLLSGIWASYTTIVSGIKDYYFGDSAGSTASQENLNEAIKKSNVTPAAAYETLSNEIESYEGDMKIQRLNKKE